MWDPGWDLGTKIGHSVTTGDLNTAKPPELHSASHLVSTHFQRFLVVSCKLVVVKATYMPRSHKRESRLDLSSELILCLTASLTSPHKVHEPSQTELWAARPSCSRLCSPSSRVTSGTVSIATHAKEGGSYPSPKILNFPHPIHHRVLLIFLGKV